MLRAPLIRKDVFMHIAQSVPLMDHLFMPYTFPDWCRSFGFDPANLLQADKKCYVFKLCIFLFCATNNICIFWAAYGT